MRERDIFLGAIDLPDAARAAYLDGACGVDAALRGRVEALLRSHEDAGSFLNFPVTSPDPGVPSTRACPASDADPGAGPTRTQGADPDDTDDALDFLAPPGRPDSLGRIGHYEVLEILGRGGFGVVFRAFDDKLQRVVAIKVLSPSMAATSPARRRFLREARSAALIQHENVVRIHDTGEEPLPFLVMEFVPGETLQQRLDRAGPLEVAEALKIARQVAEGLAAAHEKGLIHRDIKPSNILIDGSPQRQVKITDFGLARAADDASLTRSGVVAGTPMYMAPEQARGEALDHRADLFALGSVLYTMLTGRPPFRAETTLAVLKRVAEDAPRPMREVIPEVPEWLCQIVGKLHAKNPAERFQTAEEVAALLADCETQLKVHSTVKDFARIPGGKPARRFGQWKRATTAMLIALTALGVLGIDALFHAGPRPGEPHPSAGWGEVVNPLGRSRLTETGGRLTVTVPGDRLYDLNPLPNFNLNAPRVLKEVEDDFEARVTVLPFPRPQSKQGLREEAAYVGAGLVVWQDDTCLLRLFRAGMGHNNNGAPYVHAEWFAPGKHDQKLEYVSDGRLHLRIHRTGGKLHLAYSSDGQRWNALVPPVADLPLGARVRVGVAAVNALNREFTARFEGFELKGSSPGRPTSDEDRLQGVWIAESVDSLGQPLPAERAKQMRLEFTGSNLRVTMGKQADAGTFKLDPTANPKEIDAIGDEGGTPGIYRFDGDKLILCIGEPGSNRPRNFKTGPDTGPLLLVTLRRATAPPSAIAPFGAAKAKEHQDAWARHLGVPVETTNGIGMKLRLIPPGWARAGSTAEAVETVIKATGSESWAHQEIRGEVPANTVNIDGPFFMGVHEVTREQFERFVAETGYVTAAEASGKGGLAWDESEGRDVRKPEYTWKNATYVPSRQHPVVFVTLADAQAFCDWLGRKDGRRYALPSEAQWEFACRAGTTTPWYCGAAPESLDAYEWIKTNADDRSRAVGGKKPNPFGLFDMSGNVSEFVLDAAQKPVHRGGTTAFSPWLSRSASRYRIGEASYSHARGGFRVAIVGDLKPNAPAGPAPQPKP